MTTATHLHSEFSQSRKTFDVALSAGETTTASSTPTACQVIRIEAYAPAEPEAPTGFSSIDDLAAAWDADPAQQADMSEAREWLANTLLAEEGDTVRSLRLRKGLSQAQLAAAIKSSQPHIARIERGSDSLMIDTCRRLAGALGVDLNTLDGALRRQEAIARGRA